ncbi:uncharacterized protein LOC127865162 isoform X4 [Dreissena polymorpha]|nr:uncharacterized protein LOC127865162 isoform X4 [Dreissena polymorpha]
MCPVFMCDGWSITTVEGLGSQRDGLHPIQDRLDKYNGSQCGFCSPAQIMNMYALLLNDTEPSKQEIEDAYDGILCRCTGYRSILDAMKSFADSKCSPTDIEDLETKTCRKTGKPCPGKCSNPATPKPERPLHLVLDSAQWFKPTTLTQLYDLLNQYKEKDMRLVLGCTGFGVYKDIGPWNYDILIDLHGVKDLYQIATSPQLQIGANVTLTSMMVTLSSCDLPKDKYPYLAECVNYIQRIAHTNVRNAGSWAGNLMMKHKHPEFVSDMFVMLETVRAQIFINGSTSVTANQLLATDMTGKVLTHVILPSFSANTVVKFYKVAKRSQNAHAYVSVGILMTCDANLVVQEKPAIVYAGISKTFTHATDLETFLQGKQLSDPSVIAKAIQILSKEIVPEADLLAGSIQFRNSLAVNLFYRFAIFMLGDKLDLRCRSGGFPLERPLSSGTQTYSTKTEEWPLTEPLLKVEGKSQVTGEAVYINDIAPAPGELYAAFALSHMGSAQLDSIDSSKAMEMQGVVKVLLAQHIPGVNNAMPSPYLPEEVLCSRRVMYAGQAIALVIADNEETAYSAARAVTASYSDVRPPVLTIEEAIKQGMVFPKQADDIVMGDAEGAIAKSAHMISGEIHCGTQAHFSLETQISIAVPTEDGMKVYASSQWIDYTQKCVAQVLGVPCASIDVEVRRLGGAYGAKISRNFAIAAASAIAANAVNGPVRFAMNFHTNLENVGKRFPYLAKYQVGFDDTGKLNGVKVTYYCDCGYSVNDCTVGDIMYFGDNAYYCPNWHMVPVAVQTNTPSNSYCRAPGSTPGIFIMETIMQHISKTLCKDSTEVKQLNLYKKGQVTPGGMTLNYCSIASLFTQLEDSAEFSTRMKAVKMFNQDNRWKKKGLSVVPIKYGVPWNTQNYGVNVAVYSQDGTVAVSHGGIEVGQGINTKVVQVCAYEFGIPVEMIKVKPTNVLTAAGSCYTGSSVTSELVCQSVVNACQMINQRIAPVKAKLKDPTWLQIVQECYNEGIDLATHSWFKPQSDDHFQYNSYGVTCTEVELDVLTGEHEISRVDMLFDCGESLNPFLDVGQVEGAFVMGIGYWLLEESIYDQTSGAYLTNGTWDYKPPTAKDIPADFRVTLLKDAPNPVGILRSKACGEPPLCMSCSVLFALKHAVEEARKETGQDEYFPLNGPATVEVIQQACLTNLTSTK